MADSDQDFLEYDNFIMSSITLMIANIVLILASSCYIFEKIFERYITAFSVQIALDFVNLALFIAMVWKGTSKKKLYSKRNLVIMAFMALSQGTLTVYTIVANKILSPY